MVRRILFFCCLTIFLPLSVLGGFIPAGSTSYEQTELTEIGSISEPDFLQDTSIAYELKADLLQQKAYKYLFLAAAVFFALLCVLVFIFFYRRISKIHELTKIHVREIQLRDTRIKNLTLLLTHTSQPMLLMDKKGAVKWVNTAFEKYNLFDIKNIDDTNFFKDLASDEAEVKPLKKLKETGEICTYTLNVKGKSVKRTIIPVSEADGSISGFALADHAQ